ncbi:MAG: serine/threonine protein kinase, partial [Mycobacterium sp.]
RRWSGRTVLVAAAAAIAIVAVGIVAGITVSHRSTETPTPGAPVTNQPKPPGPLDGTFIAEFGPKMELISGKPYASGATTEPYGGSWSIRSACPANGCVATATLVSRQNSTSSSLVFDDIAGRWTAVTVRTGKCNNADTEVWGAFTLQPRPDGALSGEYIETVPSPPCVTEAVPNPSLAAKQSLLLTRTGDVEPNVQVADAESQPPPVVSPAQALHGRYHRTMAFSDGSPPLEEDLTLRTDCLRTGERCVTLAYEPEVGEVMVFADGKWRRFVEGDVSCKAGGTTHIKLTAEYPFPEPRQDPITLLTGRGTVESNGDCKKVPNFDEKFERTGD